MTRRRPIAAVAAPAALVLLLFVPAPEPSVAPAPARGTAFAWARDAFWRSLETRFAEARAAGCDAQVSTMAHDLSTVARDVGALERDPLGPDAPVFDSLETALFVLGPAVAACPARLRE